jgi:hypothetical protein
MSTLEIGKYTVQYAANGFPPRIWLYNTTGGNIGQVVFRPNGASLPADNSGSLYYHLDDFQNVIDVLRNEKPVYWSFVGTGSGNENAIRTSQEAVGEGDKA